MAREIGAANTLTFAGGEIRADNTDAGGLLAALPGSPRGQAGAGAGRRRGRAGGGLGAERERAEVEVWNRTAARAQRLCAELGGTAVADPDQGAYGLIVNTTAAGLHGEDPFEHLPLDPERFSAGQTVVDMVYGERPSGLLGAAEAAGATVVDGIEILVQQGALSLQHLDRPRGADRGDARRRPAEDWSFG